MSDEGLTEQSELPAIATSIPSYPRPEQLIIIGDWQTPAAVGAPIMAALENWESLLDLALMSNIKTQAGADQLAKLLGQIGRWGQDFDELSKAFRDPYRKKAESIKAATDEVGRRLLIKSGLASNLIANFDAEKILIKERLDRQAKAEADQRAKEESDRIAAAEQQRQKEEKEEADRLKRLADEAAQASSKKKREEAQAKLAQEQQLAADAAKRRRAEQDEEQERLRTASIPAPVEFTPTRTAGTSGTPGFEWDLIDPKAFAQWIWSTGKDEWIREIQFDKRCVTAWINAQTPPEPNATWNVPGLKIRRVLSTLIKKAPKSKGAINAATTKVSLDAPQSQPQEWHETPHSSQIVRFGYNEEDRVLKVVFRANGSVYDYFQVPPEVFESFKAASSAGSFHGREIKGRYGYQKRS